VKRDPISEYLNLLRRSLTEWKPLLLPELTRILTARFPPEVDLLHLELFDDSICEPYFPFFLYSYRKKDGVQYYGTPMPTARKVFEVSPDLGYFPGWYHLLDGERRPIIDPEIWTRCGEATGYTFMGEESQAVHDWFVGCWQEVGGPSIPLSTYLVRVYADQMDEGFDLRALVPVKWRDVWR
jgi:hypothetical protein